MKIFVTGGGGFIGSALVKQMSSDHRVVAFGNGGNYPYLRKIVSKKAIFKKGDLADYQALYRLTKDADALVHLGAVAGERLCLTNPLKAVVSNVYSTLKLLDCSQKRKIKKFIFSSSYWTYFTFKKVPMPLKEDGRPEVTDTFYGILKSCSEDLLKSSGAPYLILRFSTVYGFGSGLGSQWRGIVGKYIISAFKGEPLVVYADGRQRIDLVHIDDVIMALRYFLEEEYPSREVLNVASGKPISIMEIAATIKEVASKFGMRPKIKLVNSPLGKVWPDRWLCVERLRKYINPYPTISLKEGVGEMFQKLYEVKKYDNSLYQAILQQ